MLRAPFSLDRCNAGEDERDELPDNIGEAQSRGSGVFLSRSFAQDASTASLGLAGGCASSKTVPALCLMLGSTCGRCARCLLLRTLDEWKNGRDYG